MSLRKIPNNSTLVYLYVNQGKNAAEIAKMYGVKNQRYILINLKKEGIEIRKSIGRNHGMWKGGKISCKGDGYIGIWNPGHERADSGGYVYEHTLEAEKKYGRLPKKGEVVHHINCDKHDNSQENLLIRNNKQHIYLHRSIEKLIKPLMEKGIIIFDTNENEYKFNER